MDEDDFENVHPAVLALRTICRCNNVKYKTIQRAIEQGANTVAEVATRTTATTGHCGGTCTPKIIAMIEKHGRPLVATPVAPPSDPDAWWVRK
ncbi:MAG: (2Fe-2S)-binding protein [Thermoanaerobaculia bacterium]